MIHFVSGGRQYGKTRRMIQMAAEKHAYIVCPNRRQVLHIADAAEAMGVQIPFPMTWSEFTRHEYYGPGVRGFVIDNLDQCIQQMTSIPILGASLPPVDRIELPESETAE